MADNNSVPTLIEVFCVARSRSKIEELEKRGSNKLSICRFQSSASMPLSNLVRLTSYCTVREEEEIQLDESII